MQCLPNPYTESTARYRPASPQSSEYFLRRCTFLSRWSTGGQKVTTAISKSNLWEYPVFIVWEKREINDTWSLRGERHEYDGREKPVAFMCVQHTPKKQKRLGKSQLLRTVSVASFDMLLLDRGGVSGLWASHWVKLPEKRKLFCIEV